MTVKMSLSNLIATPTELLLLTERAKDPKCLPRVRDVTSNRTLNDEGKGCKGFHIDAYSGMMLSLIEPAEIASSNGRKLSGMQAYIDLT